MSAGKSECIEVDGDRRGVVRYGKKRYLHTIHSNLGYNRHHRIGTDTAVPSAEMESWLNGIRCNENQLFTMMSSVVLYSGL